MDGPVIHYIRNYPFSREDAKKKYAEAVAAGIQQLRAFPPQNADDDVTVIRLGIKRKETRIEIPEFYGEGEADNNIGSENHKRFLAIEKILGDFDTNALTTEN
ncbi:MAG: hypothetical protein HY288_17440 [Planctomycetia bacterium]|nr:hypothetical protein [Planctomycetia bacterium]